MDNFHTPVLLQQVLDFLQVTPGSQYIDATLGGGSYSLEILKRGGRVLGIDWDKEAIDYVEKKFQEEKYDFEIGKNFTLARGNFADIQVIAHSKGFDKPAGIVFDLGVSYHQLKEGGRGFSFEKDGPLDMRMDQNLKITAADLVNLLKKGELYEIFVKVGQEKHARSISELIVSARKVEPIKTTGKLTEIIAQSYGIQSTDKIFNKALISKRVFQALRIVVNDEFKNIEKALPNAVELLDKKGKLLVISFHSLEDKIVKQQFVEFKKKNMGEIMTKKPLTPSIEEIMSNRKSRSAKLRAFRKF